MADDIDGSRYFVVQIAEYDAMKAEIERLRAENERLRALVSEWCDAETADWAELRSAPVEDWNAAVDRLNVAKKALAKEARRG